MSSSNRFRLFAMDQECRRIFDRNGANHPYYLPSDIVFPSCIQGFCLCEKKDKSPVASFSSFPYISKGRWKREKILRITRPLILQGDNELKKEAVHALMWEIYELGRRAGVNAIEVELYKEINSKIFFPSASCAVNTFNTADWPQIFEGYGFASIKVTSCFELNLKESYHDDQSIYVRKYIAGDENDKKLYYKLWSQSDHCPYEVRNYGFWYANVFGWPRIWYSELAQILNKDDYILFAEKDGDVVGFIHWWPNLYSLLIEGGRKAIFGREGSIKEALEKIEEGKIFKIVIAKKTEDYKDLVAAALMNEAFKIMKNRYNFKKSQIGNISLTNKGVTSFIRENNGKKVHEIWLMRSKYLSRFN